MTPERAPDPEGEASNQDAVEDLGEALASIIARRVREFRQQVGLTVGQLADRSGMSKGMLSKIENAQASPSLTSLARLSTALSVPVTAFFRGLEEEHDAFYVKAGDGLEIAHRGAGNYRLLGASRGPYTPMEPVLVTLLESAEVFPLFQHEGIELIYMLEGIVEYGYGTSRYVMEPGDSLLFEGQVAHGPTALLELPIKFLSVKVYTGTEGSRVRE